MKYTVKEQRNILHTIRKKANLTGHILHTNCVLEHVIERNIRGKYGGEGKPRKKMYPATG
jgi:hypothetical protein